MALPFSTCGKIRKFTREKTKAKTKDLVLKNVYSKGISTGKVGNRCIVY